MYKGVARKPGRFDYRIDARLVRVVRNLETPAGYPLAVGERRPDEMLCPRRVRRPHCCGTDLCLVVHLRGIPEVRHDESAVRALERQTQAGSVEQVALDDLDSPLIECLGCSADRVATDNANREFARCEQRVDHAAALSPATTDHRDYRLCHCLLSLSSEHRNLVYCCSRQQTL